MKSPLLAAAAVAAFALVGAPNNAEAGPRRGGGGSAGGGAVHGGFGHSHHGHGHRHSYSKHGHHHHHHHHAPAYKVSTVEVNRRVHCRTAYDHRGRPYSYHVTVVTYCDHYSNGTTRTWSRTFS